MKNLVVGISDCQVSDDPDVCLITYALGSCVAVIIYDPISCVGGLLHFLLPDSRLDTAKAIQQPFAFANTGIPALFRLAYSKGAVKSRLQITAAGGAQIFQEDAFQIGRRNQNAVRSILSSAGLMLHHEHTGGRHSRTIRLEIRSGKVLMKTSLSNDREKTAGIGR